jgi:hypothetical protein
MQYIDKVILEETNAGLLWAHFSDEEVSFSLFQISPMKAPGPDG